MLGEPVFGSAADAFILILNRSVGTGSGSPSGFAQHQPEFQPEPDDEPEPVAHAIAVDDAEPVTVGRPRARALPRPPRRATGGGGTAGFQHASLLVIGIAAVLVGAASLVYRRRILRNR